MLKNKNFIMTRYELSIAVTRTFNTKLNEHRERINMPCPLEKTDSALYYCVLCQLQPSHVWPLLR